MPLHNAVNPRLYLRHRRPNTPAIFQNCRRAARCGVIVRPDLIAYMPRNAEQVTLDYDIARGLADALKLKLESVTVKNYAEMMEKLLGGEGDIVAASLTITPERVKRAAFSVPYLYVDEYLITASRDSLPETIADLAGMDIHVRQSSSFNQTLVDIQQQVARLCTSTPLPGNAQCRRPDGRGCARQIRSDRIRCPYLAHPVPTITTTWSRRWCWPKIARSP